MCGLWSWAWRKGHGLTETRLSIGSITVEMGHSSQTSTEQQHTDGVIGHIGWVSDVEDKK